MRIRAATILVFSLFAAAASAQPVFPRAGGGGGQAANTPPSDLITKLTPDQVVQIANAASFPAHVEETSDHQKRVIVEFWGKDVFAGVLLDHCDADGSGCRTLEIFTNFGKSDNVKGAWMDAWNRSRIAVKAYRNTTGDLIFEYDLPLFTGVTSSYVEAAFKLFKVAVDGAPDFKP